MSEDPSAHVDPDAVGLPGTGYRGVDGAGDPTRTISPGQAALEVEMERLHKEARQLAAMLPGLTVSQAQAAVTRAPALRIRFIAEGDTRTEEFVPGRITAMIRSGTVAEASAG